MARIEPARKVCRLSADISGVAPPSHMSVESEPKRPVLYDHNGSALVRQIGFKQPHRESKETSR